MDYFFGINSILILYEKADFFGKFIAIYWM